MIYISEAKIRDCVDPLLLEQFDREVFDIFEDPKVDRVQPGLLKIEGRYRVCNYRGVKCYYLQFALTGPDFEDDAVANKGVAYSVRDQLKPKHFLMDEMDQDHFHSVSMAPSALGEIHLQSCSRKNLCCLNMKRYMCSVSFLPVLSSFYLYL